MDIPALSHHIEPRAENVHFSEHLHQPQAGCADKCEKIDKNYSVVFLTQMFLVHYHNIVPNSSLTWKVYDVYKTYASITMLVTAIVE